MLDKQTQLKYDQLIHLFRQMGRALIAYSGGIDSTLLLKVGTDQLGPDCIAFLAVSASLSPTEHNEAVKLAKQIGANLHELYTDELNNSFYVQNDQNRCFYCKTELFQKISETADELGIATIIDGSNMDDIQDYRPGRRAAENFGVRSLLVEAEFSKNDIRMLAKHLKLPNWNKPAQPCLSSRIAYGVAVNEGILAQIDQAESILKDHDFKIVRVRYHQNSVSIEVGENEVKRFSDQVLLQRVYNEFEKIGLKNIKIDKDGYSSGKLNVIDNQAL